MPGVSDFQPLIDFCQQPAPNPYVRPVALARMYIHRQEHGVEKLYLGFLNFIPSNSSRFFGAYIHFQGMLSGESPPTNVAMALAIGNNFATYDLIWSGGSPTGGYGWEEHDVESIQDSGADWLQFPAAPIGPDHLIGSITLVGSFTWA